MNRARTRWPWRAALTAAAACGVCGAAAQPVAYALVPEQSFVTFEVLHFGISTIRGRFGPHAGRPG